MFVHFLKSRWTLELSWKFFEKYKCPGTVFSPKLQMWFYWVAMFKKQLDYTMIFYLYLVCFIFSPSYSMFPFHLVHVFQHLHFFLVVLSQVFIKSSRKAFLYIVWETFFFLFPKYQTNVTLSFMLGMDIVYTPFWICRNGWKQNSPFCAF